MSAADEAAAAVQRELDRTTLEGRCRSSHAILRAHKLFDSPSPPSVADVAIRLRAEQSVLIEYINRRLGALTSAAGDTVTPPFADLNDVAHLSSNATVDAGAALAVKARYLNLRYKKIPRIAWDAAAIHGDIIFGNSVQLPLRFDEAALSELLDRRLRAVEIMTHHVNPYPDVPVWNLSPSGPWLDQRPMRIFEYPSVPATEFKSILHGNPDWKLFDDSYGGEYHYLPEVGWPILLPPVTNSGASLDPDRSLITLRQVGAHTRTDMIRALFRTPRTNFRARAWITCDIASTAIAMEALWFGLSRRRGNVNALEWALDARPPDDVKLGPITPADDDRHRIMNDGDDDIYFEKKRVTRDEIQIGDLAIFWNSRVYEVLARGFWRNEYCYVMDIERDVITGNVGVGTGPLIRLAGHGIEECNYGEMESKMQFLVTGLVDLALKRIDDHLATYPNAKYVPYQVLDETPATLCLWDPYEPFAAPGAWWIMIREEKWRSWGYGTEDEAVADIPLAVRKDEHPGPGYEDPPGPLHAIYFPLHQPKVPSSDPDRWRTYLAQRRIDGAYTVDSKLVRITYLGQIPIPGLFRRGQQQLVDVLRPRPRTTVETP